ncbi:MAG: CdaR family protein [Aerococcaceae bacterium]|nr:CdaR family protein [Aerococcaceae bacterium]
MNKHRLMDNIWIVRGISLLFALFLFSGVRSGYRTPVQSQQSTSVDSTETIANVPLALGKHDADVFITNVPETVNVTLKGPKNIIQQLTPENFQVVTEDFQERQTGRTSLKVLVQGLPEKVTYQTNPSQISVNIARKQTITLPIEYELAADAIADNHYVSSISIQPEEVTLTGTEETIAKVARVYVRITTNQPRSRSFTEKYRLQIVDESGKLLDINASNTSIETVVNISAHEKEVPLKIVPIGEQEMYQYAYQFTNASSVIIQSSSEILNKIEQVMVEVDVSTLTESGIVKGYVVFPEGAEQINVREVDIQVTLEAPDSESSSSLESETSESESLLESVVSELSTSLESAESTSETEQSSE